MSALTFFLSLFAAAALASGLTCVALWFYYKRKVEPELERRVEQSLEALGAEVGRQVRAGVVAGVTDLANGDALLRTTEKVASSGAALVDEGLNALFGRPRRRR